MPGEDETKLENQEPTNEETEEKQEEERAERYEDRVMASILGVVHSEDDG